MRILLIAAIASSVALAGCSGGEKNSSANNSASANGTSAAGSAFRQQAAQQCEQQMQAMAAQMPPGVDPASICGCAVETAFANQPDPAAFFRTPAGKQALVQGMLSCLQRPKGAGGVPPK